MIGIFRACFFNISIQRDLPLDPYHGHFFECLPTYILAELKRIIRTMIVCVGLILNLLVCWFVGLLVCWFVGLLVCWFAGLLVCWFAGDWIFYSVRFYLGLAWQKMNGTSEVF